MGTAFTLLALNDSLVHCRGVPVARLNVVFWIHVPSLGRRLSRAMETMRIPVLIGKPLRGSWTRALFRSSWANKDIQKPLPTRRWLPSIAVL